MLSRTDLNVACGKNVYRLCKKEVYEMIRTTALTYTLDTILKIIFMGIGPHVDNHEDRAT